MKIMITLLLFFSCQVSSQDFKDLFNTDSSPGVACYRIPAITTIANGDILVAIDERVPSCADLRGNKDINIVLRRSMDNGENWSAIERIIDFEEGKSASDPSFIFDAETGEIFLFYNYMDLINEEDVYYLHYVKSVDNGKTWSNPVDITDQITEKNWGADFKFITSGRGTQDTDGRLLHTIVNLEKGTHVFGSEDHGKTWQLYGKALKPGDESKILTLSDGSWMVNSRVNRSGLRYTHISHDHGSTWQSEPNPTLIDPSCNASIIRYNDQTILFLNANDTKERKNLTIRKSIDEGKTWSSGSVIYPGASAYSTMVVLKDGSIGIFFEKDDYVANVFTKVNLDYIQ